MDFSTDLKIFGVNNRKKISCDLSYFYIDLEESTRGWFYMHNSMRNLAPGPYFTINIIERDYTRTSRIITCIAILTNLTIFYSLKGLFLWGLMIKQGFSILRGYKEKNFKLFWRISELTTEKNSVVIALLPYIY